MFIYISVDSSGGLDSLRARLIMITMTAVLNPKRAQNLPGAFCSAVEASQTSLHSPTLVVHLV